METLFSPEFQRHVYGVVDCGSLLWHLQNERIVQILGTAYYHPVLPLIPNPDREEQIPRWLGIGHHVFWRPNTGWHHGRDFTRWTQVPDTKGRIATELELSKTIHEARRRAEEVNSRLPEPRYELESSLWHLLRAETSCYVYWGEAWVSRAHHDLDEANRHLALATDLLHET